MILQRLQAYEEGRVKDYEKLDKEVKKTCRQDKRHHLLQKVKPDMSAKEQWKVLKSFKQEFNPQQYARNDMHGQRVPLGQVAEATAEYLEQVQWGTGTDPPPPATMVSLYTRQSKTI